ncbi:hypothetical protein, partial [uncultured Sutterella sp.]|uniref:hypothetical protein n=1 Tax=uncultured Sutterella sp. TaxID=286133 RepID=UPI0025D2A1D4
MNSTPHGRCRKISVESAELSLGAKSRESGRFSGSVAEEMIVFAKEIMKSGNFAKTTEAKIALCPDPFCFALERSASTHGSDQFRPPQTDSRRDCRVPGMGDFYRVKVPMSR